MTSKPEVVTLERFINDVSAFSEKLDQSFRTRNVFDYLYRSDPLRMYGVPRGGLFVAFGLQLQKNLLCTLVENPVDAEVIVDDIEDSGATKDRFLSLHRGIEFHTLYSKEDFEDRWVIFPWEANDPTSDMSDVCIRLLQHIGEDTGRDGLLETPARFSKAFKFWTSGYSKNPRDIIKTFSSDVKTFDMVLVRNIPVYSMCEHHLAPFFGDCTIAYIPQKRVLGLSKFSRIVDIYARRLQTQENLTHQIADTIYEELGASGVGVISNCRHLCMESRGVQRPNVSTEVSALRGIFKEQSALRAEFLSLSRDK